MASLGTRDALTLVERDTAESRGGFSGAHAGDSPVVVEQRDQSRGRSSRIVIIDRRQLVGRCLAASLSEADRQTSFEVFADIESWKRQKPFVPASVVVLCRPDGNLTETEWTEITRELAFLQGEAGAPPVAVISDGENLDQIVRIIKLGVKGYIPTTTSVDIALQALQLVQAGGVYIPAECLLPCWPTSRWTSRSRPGTTISSRRGSSAWPGRSGRGRRTRSSRTSSTCARAP